MNIINTADPAVKPSVVMMVYGEGGVGKTTFSATAPKPLLLDFENGSKYFGLRGISIDAVLIKDWGDIRDQALVDVIKSDKYETIIVDPIGEAMEKLKHSMIASGDTKLVQKDGSPTMAGWGHLKKKLKEFVNFLRTSGKNVIIVAHLAEEKDEERMIKRPKIETKLADDLVNMVDVVGYMTVLRGDDGDKRAIVVDPSSDKYTAKDRTGQFGKIIEPDFSKIVKACQGTETYAWSKAKDKPVKTVSKKKEVVEIETEEKSAGATAFETAQAKALEAAAK
jgi:phage nucleotide-binding protein